MVTTPKFIRPGVRHSVAVSLLKDSPSQVRVTADIFNGKVLVVSGEDTLQRGELTTIHLQKEEITYLHVQRVCFSPCNLYMQ